jgi:N-acetylglutamate synthase-like GNAT family acetyltransferase
MEAAEQVLLEAAREKGRGEELQEAIHAHIRKKHQQKLKVLTRL